MSRNKYIFMLAILVRSAISLSSSYSIVMILGIRSSSGMWIINRYEDETTARRTTVPPLSNSAVSAITNSIGCLNKVIITLTFMTKSASVFTIVSWLYVCFVLKDKHDLISVVFQITSISSISLFLSTVKVRKY